MSRTIEEYKSEIELGINEIISLAENTPKDQLAWKPSNDEWSVMEVLSHVEEIIYYWVTELQRVIAVPGPWGRGMDAPARLEAVRQAHSRQYQDVKAGILDATAHALSAFDEIREENLAIEAPHRNPKFGSKNMHFLVEHFLVEHLQKHITQIKRVKKQYQEQHINT
ncbi:DinB family protein [Bacillus sp. FJAT-29814]|uniref:DinB family protein n=1 Tax=Bacillus sp. FJAT-29814 TaxID=1729688 RepID=UPI00083642BE|nr:DinB family protein [Bacillus sp. FJAT-29814]